MIEMVVIPVVGLVIGFWFAARVIRARDGLTRRQMLKRLLGRER